MKTAIQLLREKWYSGILLLQKDFDEFEEIEKQQIIEAHGIKKDYSFSQIDPTTITGEQYYNEKFKSE